MCQSRIFWALTPRTVARPTCDPATAIRKSRFFRVSSVVIFITIGNSGCQDFSVARQRGWQGYFARRAKEPSRPVRYELTPQAIAVGASRPSLRRFCPPWPGSFRFFFGPRFGGERQSPTRSMRFWVLLPVVALWVGSRVEATNRKGGKTSRVLLFVREMGTFSTVYFIHDFPSL